MPTETIVLEQMFWFYLHNAAAESNEENWHMIICNIAICVLGGTLLVVEGCGVAVHLWLSVG